MSFFSGFAQLSTGRERTPCSPINAYTKEPCSPAFILRCQWRNQWASGVAMRCMYVSILPNVFGVLYMGWRGVIELNIKPRRHVVGMLNVNEEW